jgi:hypothetical protein
MKCELGRKMGPLAKENQTPRLRIRDVVGQLQYSCAFVSFQFVYVFAYVSLHIRFLGSALPSMLTDGGQHKGRESFPCVTGNSIGDHCAVGPHLQVDMMGKVRCTM